MCFLVCDAALLLCVYTSPHIVYWEFGHFIDHNINNYSCYIFLFLEAEEKLYATKKEELVNQVNELFAQKYGESNCVWFRIIHRIIELITQLFGVNLLQLLNKVFMMVFHTIIVCILLVHS